MSGAPGPLVGGSKEPAAGSVLEMRRPCEMRRRACVVSLGLGEEAAPQAPGAKPVPTWGEVWECTAQSLPVTSGPPAGQPSPGCAPQHGLRGLNPGSPAKCRAGLF